MKFSTNARLIILTPETLEEANQLWAQVAHYGKYGVVKEQAQQGGAMTVCIDMAATADQCLLPKDQRYKAQEGLP